jgi:hypothetical protein
MTNDITRQTVEEFQIRVQNYGQDLKRLVSDREDIPPDVIAGIRAMADLLGREGVSFLDFSKQDTGGNYSENVNRADGSVAPSGGATGDETERFRPSDNAAMRGEPRDIEPNKNADVPVENEANAGNFDGTPMQPVTGNDPDDENRPDPSRMGEPSGADIGPNGELEIDEDLED